MIGSEGNARKPADERIWKRFRKHDIVSTMQSIYFLSPCSFPAGYVICRRRVERNLERKRGWKKKEGKKE